MCAFTRLPFVPLPDGFRRSSSRPGDTPEEVEEDSREQERAGARKRSDADPTNSEAGQTARYKTLDRRRSQHQSRLTSLPCSTQPANMKVSVTFPSPPFSCLSLSPFAILLDRLFPIPLRDSISLCGNVRSLVPPFKCKSEALSWSPAFSD